jgi:hypothetical protein
MMLAGQEHFDEAAAACRKAIMYQRTALARAPQSLSYRRLLAHHYGFLGQLERRAGRPAETATTALERRKLLPQDPVVLYGVACDLAAAAAPVGRGAAGLSPAAEQQRREYADRAAEALRQAVEYGFKDVRALRTNNDLAILRSREDFQRLCARLEEK